MPDDSRPSEVVPPSETAPEGTAGAATWAPPGVTTNSVDPGVSRWPAPAAPTPSDPSAATGPPWPRLVAAPGSGYRPPRFIRWPVVIGAILFAAQVAFFVKSGSTSSSAPSAAPYVLTAADAGFTATFPGKPQRIEKTVASGPVVLYISSHSDETVGVAYFQVTSASGFSLDGAIDGAATSLTNGKVVSRSTVTYHGQPAEDGVISFSGGIGNVRAVVIGSAAYLFEGFGSSASNFARDYRVLLATFTPKSPPTTPTTTAPAGSIALGSKIVPAPAGFSLFQDSEVQNGPLSAAGFDSFVASPGAAAQLHYSTGYQINFGDSQNGDVINVTLLEFATAGDATSFEGDFTVNGVKTRRDPTVPEGETYDSTSATGGSYEHGVVATKNNLVMIVDYGNGSSARPALIDALAAQQYARL